MLKVNSVYYGLIASNIHRISNVMVPFAGIYSVEEVFKVMEIFLW